jgi:hypothetical protein
MVAQARDKNVILSGDFKEVQSFAGSDFLTVNGDG